MGQQNEVEQEDAPVDVAVLQACTMMGGPINGAHRVPKALVLGISPSEDGLRCTVFGEGGLTYAVALPAREAAALIGWP